MPRLDFIAESEKTPVRTRISVAHQCGYCSTVRCNVARAKDLSEALVAELGD